MDINTIIAGMFALFTWTSDIDQFGVLDDQRSYVDDLFAGRPFTDDCDGFALTTVDAMRRIDVPAWTVTVRLPFDQGDHMIAVYHHNGVTWALDNRQTRPVPLSQLLKNSRYRIR